MEFDENLGILSKKAWDLVDRISGDIQSDQSMISFCRHCSELGVYCGGVAETPLMVEEERERLIAIRDSLKDVETMLVFLQISDERSRASRRVGPEVWGCRLPSHDMVRCYGRKLDVIQELNACFGDEKRKRKIELKVNHRKSWFLANFIRTLFSPWNWHNTAKLP